MAKKKIYVGVNCNREKWPYTAHRAVVRSVMSYQACKLLHGIVWYGIFFFLAIPNVIYLGSKALHIIGVWDSKIIGTMHYWSIGRLVFSASSSSSRWLHLSRQATSCGRGDLARQFPLGYRRAAVNRIVPPALVHNLYSPLVTACQGLNLFWCCQ